MSVYLTAAERAEWDELDRANEALSRDRARETAAMSTRRDALLVPSLIDRIQQLEMREFLALECLQAALAVARLREFERDQAYRALEVRHAL